jgi:uncharacterized protein YdeI (YjbR/CyaY-like superfamily)
VNNNINSAEKMMQKNVDLYFVEGCGRCALGGTPACKVHTWRDVLEELRVILLESGLEEECKWGMPCYTFNGKNVAVLAAFKGNCSVGFFKGVLLSDPKKILSLPGEDSQSTRQLKVTTLKEVKTHKSALKALLKEAIEIEKAGKKVTFKKVDEFAVPQELQEKFDEMPAFEKAFKSLTPGRQRGYLLHFSQAKQAATRKARIEKYLNQIFDGKGMMDR